MKKEVLKGMTIVRGKPDRIAYIDFLKVVAIVLVVGFHLTYQFIQNNSLRNFGFVGISLFFIISGFLLAKKYPNVESFSLKWFLKRYLRIAVLYYLALVALVFLFSRQIYSGSLWKTLLYHFAFIDFISPQTSYAIISPAWFLIPLMGLYILYPYLNRFVKQHSGFLVLAFMLMVIFRYTKGGLTSFSPLFFLGEFCFGIAFAYGRKHKVLLISLLVLLVSPIMFISYVVFYIFSFVRSSYLSFKFLHFLGANTLVIFLFHESFIRVGMGKWNLNGFSVVGGFFVLAIVTLTTTFFSRKSRKFLTAKLKLDGEVEEYGKN